MRNNNGVLDGPSCGLCGVRFLDMPKEFVLNGAHESTRNGKGRPAQQNATAKLIKAIHKPCKVKKGVRLTVSFPHAGQKNHTDSLRFFGAVFDSTGTTDIKRVVCIALCKAIHMSRIAWGEHVYFA